MFSKDFQKWVKPLLYNPESKILANHTYVRGHILHIRDWEKVREVYKVSHRKLRLIIWRLNFFLHLFESIMSVRD
jgi:hypothetical protein